MSVLSIFTPRKLLVRCLYTYVLRFCSTIDGYKIFERTCCCQLHDSAARLCHVTSNKTQSHCFSFLRLNSYNSASLNHRFLLNGDSTRVYVWWIRMAHSGIQLLGLRRRPPRCSLPCTLYSLPDGGQILPKHVVSGNWKYSVLEVVFALTVNTDADPVTSQKHFLQKGSPVITRCSLHRESSKLQPQGF